MRTIRRSSRFKKDYKREQRGQYRSVLTLELPEIIQLLSQDISLPSSARDHALTGDRQPYRDCHIKPDLILMYHKPNPEELLLVRLGTHSELDL